MTPDVAKRVKVDESDLCCICGYHNGPVVSFDRYGLYPVRVCLCEECLRGCLEKMAQGPEVDYD